MNHIPITIWDLLPSVVALLGIIVSGMVAFAVAKYKTSIELKKQKELYIGKVYELRLKHYPGIYRYLSLFAKEIEKRKVSVKEIDRLHVQVITWESSYSIYVSPLTEVLLIRFRFYTRKLCKKDYTRNELKKTLKPLIYELQQALKTELGVFDFSSHHKPTKLLGVFEEANRMSK